MARTRASRDLFRRSGERVAVEDGQVRERPGLDPAGVVRVVHPRAPRRVRRQRGRQVQRLLGEEGSRSPGGPPVHRDVYGGQRVRTRHRPVRAGREPGTRPGQRAERVLPTRSAPDRGTGSSGRPSAARTRPTAPACSRRLRARRTGRRRRDESPADGRCGAAGRCRRSSFSAASNASSASRTARSPIACTWTWNPSASSRVTCRRRATGSTNERPALAVRQPQPSKYGLEHRGGEVLGDAVLHDLHAAGPEARVAQGIPSYDELRDLLGAAVALPPQRADHPRGQPPVAGRVRRTPESRRRCSRSRRGWRPASR